MIQKNDWFRGDETDATGFASIAFGYPNALWGEPQSPISSRKQTKENEEMLGFILGTMTGGAMGVFAMCLLISGKREDEALERCRMKPKEIIDHGVCICFVNSQGQELFRLSDGESLVQNAPNGERNVSTCHYLDADSAMIDGKKWNLLEFAKEMEKRGIMLAPMELCRVPERG